MLFDLLSIGLGLALLVVAGDMLVRGAVSLALRLGIPAFIVSLTIVGFGTSAPELIISLKAAFSGFPELALGNVVGSNTANVLLILGVPAMITALHVSDRGTAKNYLYMLGATLLFMALGATGAFTLWHGVLLLAVLGVVLFIAARDAASSRLIQAEMEEEIPSTQMPSLKIALFLAAGLIGLPLGADFLVKGSVNIARELGLSEAVIGLTLVAIGTSLPELAATVMAAIRRHADVAFGNVIGSNLFNLLGIIGITALFAPIPVSAQFIRFDFIVMLAASLIMAPFIWGRFSIGRGIGALYIVSYGAYLGWLVLA